MGAKWADVKEGMEIPSLKKNCSTQQLVLWAAGSGDFYQIHYDKDFATGTGLSNIIVHGALKNAFLGQLVHDWVGNEGRIKALRLQLPRHGLPEPGHRLQGRRHEEVREGRRKTRRPRRLDREPQGPEDHPGNGHRPPPVVTIERAPFRHREGVFAARRTG